MPAGNKTPSTPQELGGVARRESLTPEERTEISRNAAVARWSMPRATHEGPLKIGDVVIPCAVLEDGTRVLTRAGFLRAIGRTGKAKGGRRYDVEFQVPVFLTAENVKPFISTELLGNSKPIQYRPLSAGGRGTALGYRADLLPQVCHVFLDAREAGVLRPNQMHIAETCKVLSRGFSVVGLTALIDEATGYQEVRDRLALQELLDAYLRKEFAAWAKRFPDEYFQEIFRLRGWKWDELRKKQGKGQGPRVIGKYTKDIVYARLAPGILEELQERNPPDDKGRRKAKHHQWLTEDVGHPALAQHLHAVIALMRAADTWEQFQKMLKKALPIRTDLGDLPLFNQQPVASIAPGRPVELSPDTPREKAS